MSVSDSSSSVGVSPPVWRGPDDPAWTFLGKQTEADEGITSSCSSSSSLSSTSRAGERRDGEEEEEEEEASCSSSPSSSSRSARSTALPASLEEEEGREGKEREDEKEEDKKEKEREDVWYVHEEGDWLYNPLEDVYFHSLSQTLHVFPSSSLGGPHGVEEKENEEKEEEGEKRGEDDHDAALVEGREEEEEGSEQEGEEEEEDEDMDVDLETDLVAGTAESKGSSEGKVEIEDRHVTKLSIPCQVVSKDSNALCYYTAVFDGHDGSSCAQYAASHLHKNFISLYRQIYSTTYRRRQDQEEKERKEEEEAEKDGEELPFSRRKKKRKRGRGGAWQGSTMLLQQINEEAIETDPKKKKNERRRETIRREERYLSVGIETVVRACVKSFQMTDHNFMSYAQRAGVETEAGSTACVLFLYGPDEEDSQLKIVTAHAGDSRAILCRDGRAFRLTEDHKPNVEGERKRIVQQGGSVLNVEGVWRVVLLDKATGRMYGLATSRALGDRRMKSPRKLVTSHPTVHIYNVNFDQDLFLVLASDGVFDVLSDDDVVSLVLQNLHKSPQDAAQCVVDEASKRGSADDKTCTVLYFKWRKDVFSASSEKNNEKEEEQKEEKEESDGIELGHGIIESEEEEEEESGAPSSSCVRRGRRRGRSKTGEEIKNDPTAEEEEEARSADGMEREQEKEQEEKRDEEDGDPDRKRREKKKASRDEKEQEEIEEERNEKEEEEEKERGEDSSHEEPSSSSSASVEGVGRGLEDIAGMASAEVYERIKQKRLREKEKEEEEEREKKRKEEEEASQDLSRQEEEEEDFDMFALK